jgi:hypothetical protein
MRQRSVEIRCRKECPMRLALNTFSLVACCSTSGKKRAQPFPPSLDSGLASAAASKSIVRIEDVALTAAEPMQEGFYEALGQNSLDAPTRIRSNGKLHQGQGRPRPRQADVEMHGCRIWV